MKIKFNQPIIWETCSAAQKKFLLTRPVISASDKVAIEVKKIIEKIKLEGDSALLELNYRFDQAVLSTLQVERTAIDAAECCISDSIKIAIKTAMGNIRRFHEAQKPAVIRVETQPGVICWQVTRPIDAIGLYIPGGSAPLLSTVMMLGIPANIAGCKQIILCSPPPIAPEILYTAKLCGITDIFQVGGAQAIAAMAFGTESIPAIGKIFGPGNIYVTEAKRQVSQSHQGTVIDMPAGPSEVLVIADRLANPVFVAADLLSQAEHGSDSQVILLTDDQEFAQRVINETAIQIIELSRADIVKKALHSSRIIIAESINQCVKISNRYGPEHLLLQTRDADELIDNITNAGSVFIGDWSPESAGDYASGTNHVLPTYGYTSTYSSLSLIDFMKRMTIQKLSKEGLLELATTIETLAEAESLTAHKNAVTLRVTEIKK
ncbi:Histidinol dehydrogenase [Candidatus Hartigia pinicola]|nr:Histidinol dehydrogenase [Candidatus Hartigia pinicola]